MARYRVLQKVKTASGYDILNPLTPFGVVKGSSSLASDLVTINFTPELPEENWDASRGIVIDISNITLTQEPSSIVIYGTNYSIDIYNNSKLAIQLALSIDNSHCLVFVNSTTLSASAFSINSVYSNSSNYANNVNVTGIAGVLPPDKGGTGQASLQATRNAMGLGNTLGVLPLANGGTGANNATTARANLGASSRATYSGTLTTTWSGTGPYTQVLSISGITAADTPIVDITLSGTAATDRSRLESWAMVGRIITAANSITVTCYDDRPTVAMPIQLLCIRA